jgi:hypothetical protein
MRKILPVAITFAALSLSTKESVLMVHGARITALAWKG